MLIFNIKIVKYLYAVFFLIAVFIPVYYVHATISCSITTQAACSDITLLRMSASTNAHAEIPGQSTTVYNNNVVCCNGVASLGNSCAASNKVIFARLTGVTNSHAEINTQSNPNYTQNACISSSLAGDVITVGYQPTNCNGYDTTLFSMEKTPTNSQVGSPGSYNNKVCASVVSQTISFNLSNSSVGFGNLTSTGLRYATPDNLGSASETESYNFTVNTNASSGYSVYIKGDTLKNGSYTIDPIGGTNSTPSIGTKAFGIRAVATGGIGTVVSPYDGSGFAYDANASTATAVGQATSGNGVTTTYSVRTVASIDDILNYGTYSTNLTYIVVPNF